MKRKGIDLPPDYKPYKLLRVCGNDFENGQIPIASATSSILLVGEGYVPSVWLTAPTGDNPDERSYVVKNNISKTSSVSVKSDQASTTVFFGDTTLVKVRNLGGDAAEVEDIDLRPVGLNIYRDEDGLRVGNSFIKNNRFKNVDTMIKIEQVKDTSDT